VVAKNQKFEQARRSDSEVESRKNLVELSLNRILRRLLLYFSTFCLFLLELDMRVGGK
jgi:hypothetical protein